MQDASLVRSHHPKSPSIIQEEDLVFRFDRGKRFLILKEYIHELERYLSDAPFGVVLFVDDGNRIHEHTKCVYLRWQ